MFDHLERFSFSRSLVFIIFGTNLVPFQLVYLLEPCLELQTKRMLSKKQVLVFSIKTLCKLKDLQSGKAKFCYINDFRKLKL